MLNGGGLAFGYGMEQDERLYEYRMGSEVFRFEALSHADAELFRGEAVEFFAERAGTLFSDDAIVGPVLVEPPPGFRMAPDSAASPHI